MDNSPVNLPKAFLGRLRFPWLFAILAGLWLFDMVTPDPVLWLDEVMLAIMTVMIGMLRKGKEGEERREGNGAPAKPERPPEKNITPPE